jgi:hypothetical protein
LMISPIKAPLQAKRSDYPTRVAPRHLPENLDV